MTVSMSVSWQYFCTVAAYHPGLQPASPTSFVDQRNLILEPICAICLARVLSGLGIPLSTFFLESGMSVRSSLHSCCSFI